MTDDAALGALSPSRANDFLTCPLLYRFRTIDRLPEPISADAVRGTVVHQVLEDIFDLPREVRTRERAELMLGPTWERLKAENPRWADELFPDEEDAAFATWLERTRTALLTYFSLEDPTRLEPSDRELYVEALLDSRLLLRGYIDRLEAAPDGALRISDYKTGRAPRSGFEDKAFFQLKLYALVLWRTRGVVPRQLQLIYLGNGEVLRHEPTEAELVATEEKINAIWDAIRAATEAGEFKPKRSRLCDWCAHQAICPEFGGTPPPLPVAA